MDTTEFSGIHIENSRSPVQVPRDQSSHSIRPTTSATGSPSLPRRRNNLPNNPTPRSSDERELDKLRKLVAEAERRDSGGGASGRGSIEPSLMSAVFGLVLAIIITITVYAFFSLYRALMKKFYHQ